MQTRTVTTLLSSRDVVRTTTLLLLPNLLRPGAISPFLTESQPAKIYLQVICSQFMEIYLHAVKRLRHT